MCGDVFIRSFINLSAVAWLEPSEDLLFFDGVFEPPYSATQEVISSPSISCPIFTISSLKEYESPVASSFDFAMLHSLRISV